VVKEHENEERDGASQGIRDSEKRTLRSNDLRVSKETFKVKERDIEETVGWNQGTED
jgi:hypothetical protein